MVPSGIQRSLGQLSFLKSHVAATLVATTGHVVGPFNWSSTHHNSHVANDASGEESGEWIFDGVQKTRTAIGPWPETLHKCRVRTGVAQVLVTNAAVMVARLGNYFHRAVLACGCGCP